MKIGIVSDSHGRAKCLRAAMDVLVASGVEAIVHCGDIGSVECVKVLASAGIDAYAVAGNMDRHVSRLQTVANASGLNFSWEVVEVPIGEGKHLVATHGHDRNVLAGLITGGQFPYVCHGHTHKARDERIGNVRVINPGALHHTRRHTVAIIDTHIDTVEYITTEE